MRARHMSIGDINPLLDLYDEQAILECACEGGRVSLLAYWMIVKPRD